jgi:hypothetical protein
MYLPEDNEQMFEILAELRIYAAMNAYSQLAEELDDALVLLQSEMRRQVSVTGSDVPRPSQDKV